MSNQRLTLNKKYLLYVSKLDSLIPIGKEMMKNTIYTHFDKKTEILPLLTSYTAFIAKIR